MRNLILLLALISSKLAVAETPVDGHFELRRYIWSTNLPGYLDNTGDPLIYGLDLELNFRVLPGWATVMVGCDASGNAHGFSQAAGRAGVIGHLWNFDVGIVHRSPHSFDHTNINMPRFFNANWVVVRYNFNKSLR